MYRGRYVLHSEEPDRAFKRASAGISLQGKCATGPAAQWAQDRSELSSTRGPYLSSSVGLNAGELDHLRPLFGGLGDDRPEFRRRAAKRRAAQLDDTGLDFPIGDAGIEFLVQHGDDFRRSVPGRA